MNLSSKAQTTIRIGAEDRASPALRQTQANIRGLGTAGAFSLKKMALLGAGIYGVIAACRILSRVVKTAISTGAEFEEQLSNVEAVTGAGAAELQRMADVAKHLGKVTVFSAVAAAKAMYELGSQGMKTAQDMNNLLGPTMNLAAAMKIELPEATRMVLATLKTYGMEMSEAGRVTDVLANAYANSAANADKLRVTLQYAGAAFDATGKSIEQTIAPLELLYDRAIEASRAGTSLQQILMALVDPTAEAEKTIYKLGLTVDELNPKTRSLAEIFGKLRDAGMELEDAADMFQKRAANTALILAENADKLNEYEAGLRTAGKAEEMARIQLDNLKGSWTLLKSSIEGVYLALTSGGILVTLKSLLDERIIPLVNATADWVNKLGGVEGVLRKVRESMVRFLADETFRVQVMGNLEEVGQKAGEWFTLFMTHLARIVGAFGPVIWAPLSVAFGRMLMNVKVRFADMIENLGIELARQIGPAGSIMLLGLPQIFKAAGKAMREAWATDEMNQQLQDAGKNAAVLAGVLKTITGWQKKITDRSKEAGEPPVFGKPTVPGGAGAPAIPSAGKDAAREIAAAYRALGIESAESMRQMAKDTTAAFRMILESGKEPPEHLIALWDMYFLKTSDEFKKQMVMLPKEMRVFSLELEKLAESERENRKKTRKDWAEQQKETAAVWAKMEEYMAAYSSRRKVTASKMREWERKARREVAAEEKQTMDHWEGLEDAMALATRAAGQFFGQAPEYMEKYGGYFVRHVLDPWGLVSGAARGAIDGIKTAWQSFRDEGLDAPEVDWEPLGQSATDGLSGPESTVGQAVSDGLATWDDMVGTALSVTGFAQRFGTIRMSGVIGAGLSGETSILGREVKSGLGTWQSIVASELGLIEFAPYLDPSGLVDAFSDTGTFGSQMKLGLSSVQGQIQDAIGDEETEGGWWGTFKGWIGGLAGSVWDWLTGPEEQALPREQNVEDTQLGRQAKQMGAEIARLLSLNIGDKVALMVPDDIRRGFKAEDVDTAVHDVGDDLADTLATEFVDSFVFYVDTGLSAMRFAQGMNLSEIYGLVNFGNQMANAVADAFIAEFTRRIDDWIGGGGGLPEEPVIAKLAPMPSWVQNLTAEQQYYWEREGSPMSFANLSAFVDFVNRLPSYQSGGVVGMLHQGEGVVNQMGMARLGAGNLEALNEGRGVGNTINVTVNALDSRDVAQWFEEKLEPLLRRKSMDGYDVVFQGGVRQAS